MHYILYSNCNVINHILMNLAQMNVGVTENVNKMER